MRARGEPGEGRPIRSQQLLSLCLSLSWSCVVLSGSAGSKEDLPGPWQARARTQCQLSVVSVGARVEAHVCVSAGRCLSAPCPRAGTRTARPRDTASATTASPPRSASAKDGWPCAEDRIGSTPPRPGQFKIIKILSFLGSRHAVDTRVRPHCPGARTPKRIYFGQSSDFSLG